MTARGREPFLISVPIETDDGLDLSIDVGTDPSDGTSQVELCVYADGNAAQTFMDPVAARRLGHALLAAADVAYWTAQ